jgi:hypothetical protein
MMRGKRREPVLTGIVKFTKRAACASGIHPRSPSASFSNDDASASSFVPERARASAGIAAEKPNFF